jgi:hypothetical protein
MHGAARGGAPRRTRWWWFRRGAPFAGERKSVVDHPAHDEHRRRELAPALCHDAVLADDGLWLGGEALVAPMYVSALHAAGHADDSGADPSWRVL